MVIPTVHLNGTSKEALLSQLSAAICALGKALESLAEASPHSRDYYIQEAGAFVRAEQEHAARISSVMVVRDELASIYAQVSSQGSRRDS
jgi:hypothetical protein